MHERCLGTEEGLYVIIQGVGVLIAGQKYNGRQGQQTPDEI